MSYIISNDFFSPLKYFVMVTKAILFSIIHNFTISIGMPSVICINIPNQNQILKIPDSGRDVTYI